MFKKICIIFLSTCIAAAMIFSTSAFCSYNGELNGVTMCDMDAVKVSY